jgi:prenyltransferase beta subunit
MLILLSTGNAGAPKDSAWEGKDLTPSSPFSLSELTGTSVSMGDYLVIEASGQNIPENGMAISEQLTERGLSVQIVDIGDIMIQHNLVKQAPVLILDASLGSDQGTAIGQEIISLLIKYDRPIVLLGNACWLVHRFRGDSQAAKTAPVETDLLFSSSQAGAVFFSSPHPMTNRSPLTTESLNLPVDQPQTERSRLVNLTQAQKNDALPFLRYESWPLDSFMVGMEDPLHWTVEGTSFLVNIIAYAAAMSESVLSRTIADLQSEGTFAGGFAYPHTSTMDATYHAVRMADNLLNNSRWNEWINTHSSQITTILDSMFSDFGAEAGFGPNSWSSTVSLTDTANGLWIVEVCGLDAEFPTSELVSYITSRQETDGGFGNAVDVTYYATEALSAANSLPNIDLQELSYWLEDCEITSADAPSQPEKWGGIARNPSSSSPTNLYAMYCLLARELISNPHNDQKLIEWILDTSNQDGSFSNSLSPGDSMVQGTASALISLEVKGQLSSANRTNGLAWLELNQLDSGGFGVDNKSSDILAKTSETSLVSLTLKWLEEKTNILGLNILDYLQSIETTIGFELMEPAASLMWSSYMSKASRYAHAGGIVDVDGMNSYQAMFSSWSIYPPFGNFSTAHAPEYLIDQYWTTSTWTQLFGAKLSDEIEAFLSPSVESAVVQYIQQCEYNGDHYRQKAMSFDRRMQFTVAAIETLYLLDRLDAIQYRASIENLIMSEYSEGTWDSSDWNLRPFAGTQSAIDHLCTRTAMRLGLVNETIAAEIASVVNTRIQYSDLWALSQDVALLSLLSTEFSVSFDAIDSSHVLNALGPSPFADGWYNSTVLWQPVFTSNIMEMISVLGLRHKVFDVEGTQLSSSIPNQAELGETISIDVNLNSSSDTGTIFVKAFGKWRKFDNVTNNEVLVLDVPTNASSLGSNDIFLMLWNEGQSRSFHLGSVEVMGTLNGSMTVETPFVLIGDWINATVEWWIGSGTDAGLTNITIRLGSPTNYQEWYVSEFSPYALSIPSDGASCGVHNLTVTLEREHCSSFILQDQIEVQPADFTYISSIAELDGKMGTEMNIPVSLHFSENGSFISDQLISLEIKDEYGTTVFVDSILSQDTAEELFWTPSGMGHYSFSLVFERNGTLEESFFSGLLHIYQDTNLTWTEIGTADQYSIILAFVELTDQSGEPLVGQTVILTVYDPNSASIVNETAITNSTGYANVSIELTENGEYTLYAEFAGLELLSSSLQTSTFVSYTDTSVSIDGIESGLVNTTWFINARLEDSGGHPLDGLQVTLTITLLPSTLVLEQTLTTNVTGDILLQWTADSAGGYLVEATFAGSLSRGFSADSVTIDLRIPVTHHISFSGGFEVGREAWVSVAAEDHTQTPVNGITVQLVVRDPHGNIIFTDSAILDDGFANFSWAPSVRGANRITVSNGNENWFNASESKEIADVFEQPEIHLSLQNTAIAPLTNLLLIHVMDSSGTPVDAITLHISIWLNEILILDSTNITDSNGNTSVSVLLVEPGELEIYVSMVQQQYLLTAQGISMSPVLASTTLEVNLSGLPISQGQVLPISVLLSDWRETPLSGATVLITVENAIGYVVQSDTRITGSDGRCVMAYTCSFVGDFAIRADYAGFMLNASSQDSQLQRVTVVPDIVLENEPSAEVGAAFQVSVGLVDNLDDWIAGKSVELTIDQDGVTIFESSKLTIDGLVMFSWTPTERGPYVISIIHQGDGYHYLYNDTETDLNALEQVAGSLSLSTNSVDVFGGVSLSYELTGSSQTQGVSILFEVLDMDLIPLWDMTYSTDSNGIAMVNYTAEHAHGDLVVRAEPTEGQFLLGGITQDQFIVRTSCHLSSQLAPTPPVINEQLTLLLTGESDLGTYLSDVTVRVEIKRGQQQLLLDYVTLANGTASLLFTPTEKGLYSVEVRISESPLYYAMTDEFYHTIYCPTNLEITDIDSVLEIGETLSVTIRLTNELDGLMEGQTITLSLGSILGPVDLVTNQDGVVTWQPTVDVEGEFILVATYSTWETYLASSIEAEVDVNFGTMLHVEDLSAGNLVAGIAPLNMSFLLTDTDGSPLEGRTVNISVYHGELGIIGHSSYIQQGFSNEFVQVMLERMGDYTVLIIFEGTEHYHPSSSAIEVFVFGTTSVIIDAPTSVDRVENENITITFIDELRETLKPSLLSYSLNLIGTSSSIEDRISIENGVISVHLLGLECGTYSLSVVVDDSAIRLGSSSSDIFNITSQAHFNITSQNLNGLIHNDHWIRFRVEDSLNQTISDATIEVSLWAPDGREIYGSLLSTVTSLQTDEGWAEIAWLPNRIGNYTLVVRYHGTEYIENTTLQMIILTRHETSFVAEIPKRISYPDELEFNLELQYENGPLVNASVLLSLVRDSEILHTASRRTSFAGIAVFEVTGLQGGNYTLIVEYQGSSDFADCRLIHELIVQPEVELELTVLSMPYVQVKGEFQITLFIGGVDSVWTGTLIAEIVGEGGFSEKLLEVAVGPNATKNIPVFFEQEGNYTIRYGVTGIPLLGDLLYSSSILITAKPLTIPMDEASFPVAISGVVIAIIGLVLKKKLGIAIEELPTDWDV